MTTLTVDTYLQRLNGAGIHIGETIGHMPAPITKDMLARLILTPHVTGTSRTQIGQLVSAIGAMPTLRVLLDSTDEERVERGIEPVDGYPPIGVAKIGDVAGWISAALQRAGRGAFELLTPEHDYWPTSMRDLGNDQPLQLWARGNLEPLQTWQNVGVTGARAATGYGEQVTMQFAADLTERGHNVVNGGAYGIDGMAVRASLAAGGTPIVVLSGGIDRYHPSGHEALLTRVAEVGVLVSEHHPNITPTKMGAIRASAIKAALAHSTVIVEAGFRSSSLQVASDAHKLGRFVGGVPGPRTSAASSGVHHLIKEGIAKLVTDYDDIPLVGSDPLPTMTREITRHVDVALHTTDPAAASPTQAL
jgi:DNA processing protein